MGVGPVRTCNTITTPSSATRLKCQGVMCCASVGVASAAAHETFRVLIMIIQLDTRMPQVCWYVAAA
jgi:hypothetical protein